MTPTRFVAPFFVLFCPLVAIAADRDPNVARSVVSEGDVRVSVPNLKPLIFRQTPAGIERMLYLSLEPVRHELRKQLILQCVVAGRILERELLDVPGGGAWDTIWLPEPTPETLRLEIRQRPHTVLWSGEIRVPKRDGQDVLIPQSRCFSVGNLKPLCLRGTNYYPRWQPWPGLWRAMDAKHFEAEFAEMDKLGINTIRTFYNFDPDAKLHRSDGAFMPVLLSRINELLSVADRHRIKVMLCLGGPPPLTNLAMQRRWFRFGVEPFLYDGRILMWDLINEPGGDKGPNATPDLSQWIRRMWAELKRIDTNHMATVGLCWQFDQLWDLEVKPEVAQFHNYSSAVGVQPAGQPRVRNVADDLRNIANFIANRPLVIGEFGFTSVVDEAKGWKGSEARQLEIYRGVIEGTEAAVKSGVNVAGVYNWCAFHFGPGWMGKGEQAFGVIRVDGTLKPAGEYLRDTYLRWRGRQRAPWEK